MMMVGVTDWGNTAREEFRIFQQGMGLNKVLGLSKCGRC